MTLYIHSNIIGNILSSTLHSNPHNPHVEDHLKCTTSLSGWSAMRAATCMEMKTENQSATSGLSKKGIYFTVSTILTEIRNTSPA